MPDIDAAQEAVMEAVDRLRFSWEAEPHAFGEAAVEYADELLALACRDLYYAMEAQPRDKRPVGWNTKPKNQMLPVMLSKADLERLVMTMQQASDEEESEDYAAAANLLHRLREESWAFDRHPEGDAS